MTAKQERHDLLIEKVPIDRKITGYKTLLYIGANPMRNDELDELMNMGYKATILEAFEPNCDELKTRGFSRVINADIVDYEFEKDFDVIMFWHGPEHLRHQDLKPTIKKLEEHCKLLIFACPFGTYPQGIEYGNYYEIHHSHIYPDFFEVHNYKTATLGEVDNQGSHLMAWKLTKDGKLPS